MKLKPFRVLWSFFKYALWLLLFIIAAICLRIFILEFYYVPSTSMSGALFEGDVIMVSKARYGAVMPRTISEIPFISGLTSIKPLGVLSNTFHFNYHRMSGWEKPVNGDIVVFKFCDTPELIIKRCIGTPGDTLQINHDTVYINHVVQPLTEEIRFYYRMQSYNGIYDETVLKQFIDRKNRIMQVDPNGVVLSLTYKEANIFAEKEQIKTLTFLEDTNFNNPTEYFPYKGDLGWNSSFYGPINIPRKGDSVLLDTTSLPFYKKIIEEYEHNTLEIYKNRIYINAFPQQYYTFKKDYYFMMGDNRHCSYDSRFRGFIPEDGILAKANYVIISVEKDPWQKKGMRWGRCFKKIR